MGSIKNNMRFALVVGFLTMQCVDGLRLPTQSFIEEERSWQELTFSSKQAAVPSDLHTRMESETMLDDKLTSTLWQHEFFHDPSGDCGVVVAAYGTADGKYLKAALKTIRRISQLNPRKGWCKGAPELMQVPVTLNTNLPPTEVQKLLSETSVNTLQRIDQLDVTPSNSSHWNRLGSPIYQWYHCQIFKHAPYKLTVYLDADATICPKADLQSMFSDAEEQKWDLAFEDSAWHGGYGMSHSNKRNPHPPTVQSEEDLKKWEQLKEPNNGAVFFRKDKAQQFSNDFCRYLHEDFKKDDVFGDQLAFRSALWDNMADLKIQRFNEVPERKHATLKTNRICRYQASCQNGCTIFHSRGNL